MLQVSDTLNYLLMVNLLTDITIACIHFQLVTETANVTFVLVTESEQRVVHL